MSNLTKIDRKWRLILPVFLVVGDGQFLAEDDGAGYIVYDDRKKGRR